MNTIWKFILPLGKLILLAVLPPLALLGVQFLADAPIEWNTFLQLSLFCSAVLLIAGVCQPEIDARGTLNFHRWAILLLVFTFSIGVSYWLNHSTFLGWLFSGSLFALLLGWVTILGSGVALWKKLFVEGFFLALASFLPPLLNQIETRFSTEEFFVALEVLGLMIFWLFLRGGFTFWVRGKPQCPQPAKMYIRHSWLFTTIGLATFVGIIFTIFEYQHSFFPPEAPGFPSITSETPFICGESPPSSDVYQGKEVFQDLLEQVEENSNKKAPDYALLALGTQDQKWAHEFRVSILSEAEAGLFTEPAGSVKYGQYLASQRAYFYPLVRDAFPDLFSSADKELIHEWFSVINQRTFTVEWVDWFYALAFRYWPQGPYENQESGSGLLSLLELNELADPRLSAKNQLYLADNLRGWLTRFRVTDDAAVYQPEWIENAWFQSLYSGEINSQNQQRSFDWQRLLALPDGSSLRYNHLSTLDFANTSFWGSNLLKDETQLWLAGRALDYSAENLGRVKGQPGAEKNLVSMGRSPTNGSCLLFGDSGLPTQQGPLAPDKIVFRSGWNPDDVYMLLNLRFTGWHRYKATNSVMQVYQNQPLVIENTSEENFDWLPIGRSLFRDKRIPRENLNGLIIGKTGMAKVLYQMTGFGGPWAQDPPYYAKVTRFETTPDYDLSSTIIDDWHGWHHQRIIYFYPEGIILVFDDAQGPENHPAALTWNVVGDAMPDENRIPLGINQEASNPLEMVLFPINNLKIDIQPKDFSVEMPGYQVKYSTSSGGSIQTLTSFLFNSWSGANVQIENSTVVIRKGTLKFEMQFDSPSN